MIKSWLPARTAGLAALFAGALCVAQMAGAQEQTETMVAIVSGPINIEEGEDVEFVFALDGPAPTSDLTITCTSQRDVLSNNPENTRATPDDLRDSAGASTQSTTFPAKTVVFTPSNFNMRQRCVFHTFDDNLIEETENLTMHFESTGGGDNVRHTSGTTSAAITDNDALKIRLGITANALTINDDNANTDLIFTVTAQGNRTLSPVRIPITISGQSQFAGGSVNFGAPLPTRVTIPVGAQNTLRTATITVPIMEVDTEFEGEESVTVAFGAFPGNIPSRDETAGEQPGAVPSVIFEANPTSATTTITEDDSGSSPTLGAVSDQTYTAGTAITDLTLPEASGGDGAITYALSGLADVPGLSFDADTRVLSGTPTTQAPATTLTYTATDADRSTASGTFRVTVLANLPTLGAVSDQTYTAGTAITSLTLPEAGGGDGTITYALSDLADVPGLSFDAGTRVLSGTPTTQAPATTLTYTATVEGGDAAARRFAVTVIGPGVTISPTTLVVDEGASATYTVVLDTVPAGAVTITPSGGGAGITVSGALTFTAGNWNTAQTTTVTAAEDDTGTANGSASVTHEVTGYGGVTDADTVAVTVTDNDSAPPDEVNRVILPEVVRAMADQRTGAIARRVRESCKTPDPNGMALWGGGEYRNIGGESGGVDWDGDLTTAHLAFEARQCPESLGGILVSYSESDSDYSHRDDDTTQRGEYELDLASVHPYTGWSSADGMTDLWATVGIGWGDVEITPDGNGVNRRRKSGGDVSTQTIAFGGIRQLRSDGARILLVKSEAFVTEADFEGDADDFDVLADLEVDASRVRVSLEARRTRTLASGALLTPALELGMRHDGGSGRSGGGAEVSGALHYRDPARGLSMESLVRALLDHGGDYEDWGIGITVRREVGADGQGLSLSVSPAYGNTGGGAQKIWRDGLLEAASQTLQARLDARVGYGLPVSVLGFNGDGRLTPYGEMSLGKGERRHRLGMRWTPGARGLCSLDLFAGRNEKDHEAVDYVVLVKGEIRF